MGTSVVRQLLRRMQKRCGDLETLLGGPAAAPKSLNGERYVPERLSILCDLNRLNTLDCRRALCELAKVRCEHIDTECVRQQLLEGVRISVRQFANVHPWGSTSAIEVLMEPELEDDQVIIAVETDHLPHRLDASWKGDRVSIELAFQLMRVTQTRLRGKQAIYSVELKPASIS